MFCLCAVKRDLNITFDLKATKLLLSSTPKLKTALWIEE